MTDDRYTKETLKGLTALMQLDVDAVRAYEQAIGNIDADDIRATLEAFKGDHERHIVDLEAMIRKLGGTPPSKTPDLKGFIITGFTAIRSAAGTEAALKAMKTNEKLTNEKYQAAMTRQMPDDAMRLVQGNWTDEQRHLHYITTTLEQRSWEKHTGRAPARPEMDTHAGTP
jgi:rubrerythrin